MLGSREILQNSFVHTCLWILFAYGSSVMMCLSSIFLLRDYCSMHAILIFFLVFYEMPFFSHPGAADGRGGERAYEGTRRSSRV